MAHVKVQPYVHNTRVYVRDGDEIHRFMVFYKRHCRLPVNRAVPGIERRFRGDVLVLRESLTILPKYVGWRYVNMRAHDHVLVDFAMEE
jgi:hypothetical protein